MAVTQNRHSDVGALLSAHGLRSTAPRRAALQTLLSGGHWSVAEVFEAVKRDNPGTSLQAMYIVLTALTTAGLVRKIDTGGGAALFEARVGDNHHHLQCEVCGAITDVDCAVGQAPCLHPSENHGYLVNAADVVFRGICPDCQQRDSMQIYSDINK